MNVLKDDTGQGLVEYALIVALIAVVAVTALMMLGRKASNTLGNASQYLSN